MREILPPDRPGQWEEPEDHSHEDHVLDRPLADDTRDETDEIDFPIGAGSTLRDDRPDVIPDVEPPDEQA